MNGPYGLSRGVANRHAFDHFSIVPIVKEGCEG